jgi:GTPase SAR1 family protein
MMKVHDRTQLWSNWHLIVPGTTVSVTLLPTYVEVRDRGIIKKKIKIKNRSFDEIVEDLNLYLRSNGKLIANRILRDTLDTIGVPVAKSIMVEDEPEPIPEVEAIEESETMHTSSPVQEKKTAEKALRDAEPELKEEATARFVATPETEPEVTNWQNGYEGITEALSAVEHMSDTFMAPTGSQKQESKSRIKIDLSGEMEVKAASKSRASEPIAPDVLEQAPARAEEEQDLEDKEKPISKRSKHAIKPLVKAKVLILGEKSVGKRTLMTKASLCPLCIDEETNEVSGYIYERVFDTTNHRVEIQVWCFDYAVESRIDRRTFYASPDVLLIVYSASDRWSFESIDFWIREVAMTSEDMPPIALVANKVDERTEGGEEWDEPPVTYEEGFKAAEKIAENLGSEGSFHPVAFVETSCLTNEGVEDVFQTAADLYDDQISNT